MNKQLMIFFFALLLTNAATAQGEKAVPSVSDYNVVWNSPSESSAGSMPLGNGELGMNVWVEKNGDLLLYLSRTDAISEANRLMKLGRIRVSLTPNPFTAGMDFTQKLLLEEGVISIQAGEPGKQVSLNLYMDPNAPVAYLDMESEQKYSVKVTSESWRQQPHQITKEEALSAWLGDFPSWVKVVESADKYEATGKDIMWYHANESSVHDLVIKHQQKDAYKENFPDPISNRVFGVSLSGKGLKKETDSTMVSYGQTNNVSMKMVTCSAQKNTVNEWKKEIKKVAGRSSSVKALEASCNYWENFWKNSYIYVDIPSEPEFGRTLTQGYLLQHFMLASGGRGEFPIKFNGSIFTTDPKHTRTEMDFSPDFRYWGNDFWWQNTRLPYYAMQATGDFELMQPLFKFYLDRMEAFRTLAKKYYGAKGAFIPEVMTIFGTYANCDYGWVRDGHSPNEVLNTYIRHIWVQSLELSKLMLDYASYSGDTQFLKEKALPAIKDFLLYFDSRFVANGEQMRITPTQAVETYWYGVENDMPTVAGLHYVLGELEKLPAGFLTEEDRTYYLKLKKQLPAIPVRHLAEGQIYLPAEAFDDKRNNVENPELYVVFPFGLANLTNNNHEAGVRTYRFRHFDCSFGWGQDGQEAAMLGLEKEVVEMLRSKLKNTNANQRFMAMWGPNYDWVPDQDHGSNIMLTLQKMLLQHYDKCAYLLPCWPKEWNVSFKLHTAESTTIQGTYCNGKLNFTQNGSLKVVPLNTEK